MSRYRCKPVEVDAVPLKRAWSELLGPDAGTAEQWVLDSYNSGKFFFDGEEGEEPKNVLVVTLEGQVKTPLDSWLVRGKFGEVWPVQHLQFDHKYELI